MTPPAKSNDRSSDGAILTAIRARAMTPVATRPRKTAMLLAQRIVDEIADNDLAPGTPLQSEADMLEKYGVARGTLREALRFLEIQGVVTIKTGPGGGAVVGDPGSQPLASVIALLLQLSHTSYRSIVDARLELEPMLARKAAGSRTEEDLEVLATSIDDMVASIDHGKVFLAHNQIFHTTIAHAAGNPVLFHFAASLAWIEDGTVLGIDYADETRKPIIAAHRRIFKAIEASDGEMAEAAMRLHVGAFAKYARKNFARVLDQPLRWDQVRL
jgi:GntR family transcriptional regulator, transcriptional repressor for pyruvate dehydrogenase complex